MRLVSNLSWSLIINNKVQVPWYWDVTGQTNKNRKQKIKNEQLSMCVCDRCVTCHLLEISHTRMVRSSLLDIMSSCLGWKRTHETLFVCPLIVSTSHAFKKISAISKGQEVDEK
jgi:hypothetical protein